MVFYSIISHSPMDYVTAEACDPFFLFLLGWEGLIGVSVITSLSYLDLVVISQSPLKMDYLERQSLEVNCSQMACLHSFHKEMPFDKKTGTLAIP